MKLADLYAERMRGVSLNEQAPYYEAVLKALDSGFRKQIELELAPDSELRDYGFDQSEISYLRELVGQ